MCTSLGKNFGLMLNIFVFLFHLWQSNLNNNSYVMTYVHIVTYTSMTYDIRNFYIVAALVKIAFVCAKSVCVCVRVCACVHVYVTCSDQFT